MGELLRQFDGKGNNQYSKEGSNITDTKLTQKEVSEDIGLSKRQKDQSIRLSNIPEETFNQMVDSENVPIPMFKLINWIQILFILIIHK